MSKTRSLGDLPVETQIAITKMYDDMKERRRIQAEMSDEQKAEQERLRVQRVIAEDNGLMNPGMM